MLHNKDCLDFLTKVEDESVDLVLTDPPYFIGFDGGEGWDNQWKTEYDYLEWCDAWTNECIRVLKPNRMLVVFGTFGPDTGGINPDCCAFGPVRDQAIELGYGSSGLFISTFKYPSPPPLLTFKNCSPPPAKT